MFDTILEEFQEIFKPADVDELPELEGYDRTISNYYLLLNELSDQYPNYSKSLLSKFEKLQDKIVESYDIREGQDVFIHLEAPY